MFRSIQDEFQSLLNIVHEHTESQRQGSAEPINPSIGTMDLQLLITANEVESTRILYESRQASVSSENDLWQIYILGRALADEQRGLRYMEDTHHQLMSDMISNEENNSLLIKLSHHYPFAKTVLRFLYNLEYSENQYTYSHVNSTLQIFYYFKPYIDIRNLRNSTSTFIGFALLIATIVNTLGKIDDAKLNNAKFGMKKYKEKLMLEYVNNFLPVNYRLNKPVNNTPLSESNISWMRTFLYPDNYIDYANNKFRFLAFSIFIGIEAIMRDFVFRDETTPQMLACIMFMLSTRMILFPLILTKAGMLDNAMKHPINRTETSTRWSKGFRETNERLEIFASNVVDIPVSIASSIHSMWRRPAASAQILEMDIAEDEVNEADQSVPLLAPSFAI